MIEKFRLGGFVGTTFQRDSKFDFSINNSPGIRRIYIHGLPNYPKGGPAWEGDLNNIYINMKISTEIEDGNTIYYFYILEPNSFLGILNSRNTVNAEVPDYNPAIPSDNLSIVQFIGSDDVRDFLTIIDTSNGSSTFLQVDADVQFKMKIEGPQTKLGVVKVRIKK